jgi:hypothetical protein
MIKGSYISALVTDAIYLFCDKLSYEPDNLVDLLFPRLKEDGGELDNMEEVKELFKEKSDSLHNIAVAASKHNFKKEGKLSDANIEIIHKAILTYVKVSDDPIYKEIIELNKWQED